MRLKTYIKRLKSIANEQDYMTEAEMNHFSPEVIELIGKLQADIFNNIGDIEDIINDDKK